MEVETSSPEQTERVAARLARGRTPRYVVTVAGELGAGKTTFVRGACRGARRRRPSHEPHVHDWPRYHGRVDVSHLDLYRFQGVSSVEWGDLEPYFADAIVFVEWPERPPATSSGALRARVRLLSSLPNVG